MSKIAGWIGGVLVLIALGVIAVMTITHYSAKSATAVAQVTCVKGDQKADMDASKAQKAADDKALADTKQQLRQAQMEAAYAMAEADKASNRAATLSAALSALKKTDPSVQAWSDQKLPTSLQSMLQEGSP